MKAQCFIFIAAMAATLLLGCSPGSQQSNSDDKPSPSAPNPAVVAKLQEIVEIRQQLLQAQQRKFEAGLAQEDSAAEVALAEARLELAREQGQREAAIAELRNIVTAQSRDLERVKSRVAVGVQTSEDIERARLALLESEVRLQREARRR